MNTNDIIVDRKDFEIAHTLECGQVFRYRNEGNHYSLKTLDKECILYNRNEDEIIIENENKEYFRNYFDLDTDYGKIKDSLAPLPFMRDAVSYGHGIRILRQDPFETIISFIISANNNIPRIKKIIERICADGRFPTAEELSFYDEKFYASCGAGYRAKYLEKTSRTISEGIFDVKSIYGMDTLTANKELCSKLLGIGCKVADCILLFGYHRMDVFPVDTWIKKVYGDIFGCNDKNNIIRSKLIETYGELSGYAQQYLFYNKRENS